MSDTMEIYLQKWEQNYKKGLLSFWMLLAIAGEALYAYEMREKIEKLSKGSIVADENSIYRALRRFAKSGLVTSELRPSDIGPERRYFELSEKGKGLLVQFIQRNLSAFADNELKKAMNSITKQVKNKEKK